MLTHPFPQQRLLCINQLYNLNYVTKETLEGAFVEGYIIQVFGDSKAWAMSVFKLRRAQQTVILLLYFDFLTYASRFNVILQ